MNIRSRCRLFAKFVQSDDRGGAVRAKGGNQGFSFRPGNGMPQDQEIKSLRVVAILHCLSEIGGRNHFTTNAFQQQLATAQQRRII